MDNSEIFDAAAAGRLPEVRVLIQEYFSWLTTDHPDTDKMRAVLDSQGVSSELDNLAEHYERLWLATVDDQPAGCVAYQRINDATAEIKRLYVRPDGRGHGFGRRLMDTALAAIHKAGYTEVVLDSDPTLTTAIAMYERMGFERIDPYNDNPAEDAVFMRLEL